MLKGIADDIKKDFDKKNINYRKMVLDNSIIEKDRIPRQRLMDTLQAKVAYLEGRNDNVSKKLDKINKNVAVKDLNYRVPDYMRNINRYQNNGAVKDEYLQYPRTFNMIKLANTENTNDKYLEKFRDVDAEAKQDVLIETITNILTEKIKELEFLISVNGSIAPSQNRQIFNKFTNNGPLTTNYNQLVKLYTTPTISKSSSKEILASKFVKLNEYISAIEMGIKELLLKPGFTTPSTKNFIKDTGEIMTLLRTEAIYRHIREQIFNNSYKMITPEELNVSLLNTVQDLSYYQQQSLRDKGILNKSLIQSNIEDTDPELEQLIKLWSDIFIKENGRDPTGGEISRIVRQFKKLNKKQIKDQLKIFEITVNEKERIGATALKLKPIFDEIKLLEDDVRVKKRDITLLKKDKKTKGLEFNNKLAEISTEEKNLDAIDEKTDPQIHADKVAEIEVLNNELAIIGNDYDNIVDQIDKLNDEIKDLQNLIKQKSII